MAISTWTCAGRLHTHTAARAADRFSGGYASSQSSRPDGQSGLFAYPAQSSFGEVRHPLVWVGWAQKLGYDVLLDTAADLPTGTLDLSIVQPRLMLVRWYKLFGYPTGVGCSIARDSELARLSRPWFSGGTVKAVTIAMRWREMACLKTPLRMARSTSYPSRTLSLD